mmetsp:Transcript_10539/g.30597  ORF Transcript_10539/g.30597 Transcript_10539/m.30597 type:complete len:740 (-) Transcript_10539:141-2360(-)
MVCDKFSCLIDGLVCEHRRLERLVGDLSSDNDRLRAELIELCGSAVVGIEARSSSRDSEPVRLEVLAGDTPAKDDGETNQEAEEKGFRQSGLGNAVGSMEAFVSEEEERRKTCGFVDESPRSPTPRRHGTSACSAEAEDGRLRLRHNSAMTLGTLGSTSVFFRSSTNGMLPPKWPEWRGVECEDMDSSLLSTNGVRRTDRGFHSTQKAKSGGRLVDEAAWWSRIVLHPCSTARAIWDLLSSLIIGYDLIFIPFELGGFSVPEGYALFYVTDRCTACFWALDVFMSFITGYHSGGLIEMRMGKIAKRYAKSWLVFDLLVVAMDWIFIFLGGFSLLRIGKSNRLFRIIRTLRIVRSVKMTVRLAQILDSFRSEALRIFLNICAHGLCILTLNHYFACGWYFVGTNTAVENNWVVKFVDNEPTITRYVTALHWSFTQFTPAGMEIHPTNFSERLYTVITVFFAMITFSSFMGSITANMTALRRLSSEPATQQKILQDYFMEHGISAELGTRVWGYLKKNHFQNRKRALRKDIAVLKFLPSSMSCDLNEELYLPVIKQHPFFFHYGILHYHGARAICDTVVSEHALTLGEPVFHAGTSAETMYFVTLGKMYYEHRDPTLSSALERLQWVSEPCLWMKWYYCGTLRAQTTCQLLGIHSKALRATIMEQARARNYVRSYVSGFRAWMLQGDANEAFTWKTDIWMVLGPLKQAAFEAMPENEGIETSSKSQTWFRERGSGCEQRHV